MNKCYLISALDTDGRPTFQFSSGSAVLNHVTTLPKYVPRGVEKLAARADDVWINIMRDEWYIKACCDGV